MGILPSLELILTEKDQRRWVICQVSQWMAENPARIKTASVGHNQCSETVHDEKVAYLCSNVSDPKHAAHMILLVQFQNL